MILPNTVRTSQCVECGPDLVLSCLHQYVEIDLLEQSVVKYDTHHAGDTAQNVILGAGVIESGRNGNLSNQWF